MQHAAFVCELNGLCQRHHEFRNSPPVASEIRFALRQGAAAGELHCKERQAVMFADMVHWQDRGMFQRCDCAGFQTEPLQHAR